MEKSKLKERILMEFENLISVSCKNAEKSKEIEQLHIALLKKYYNATDVHIDYHRHRITLDIIMDNKAYKARQVNTYLPILPVNLSFDNLRKFLKSCVEKDEKSLGFYAQLLQSFAKEEAQYTLV